MVLSALDGILLFSASKLPLSVSDTSPLAEVSGGNEAQAERMSDKAINIIKITMPFFIALSFKAFYPSRYIAFADAGTETLTFLPIARACHLGKQLAAFAKSRT